MDIIGKVDKKERALMRYSLLICIFLLCGCSSTSKLKPIEFQYNNESFETIIPHINLQDATFYDAIVELQNLWAKQNGNKPIPQFVLIEPGPPEYMDDYGCITFEASDIPVIEFIKYLCIASNWKYEIIQGNVIFWTEVGIIEGWEARIYALTPLQLKFFNITEKSTPEELAGVLTKYDIKMPADINAKAKWDPRIERLIVFTLSEEHPKLEQLLKHITLIYGKEQKNTPGKDK